MTGLCQKPLFHAHYQIIILKTHTHTHNPLSAAKLDSLNRDDDDRVNDEIISRLAFSEMLLFLLLLEYEIIDGPRGEELGGRGHIKNIDRGIYL